MPIIAAACMFCTQFSLIRTTQTPGNYIQNDIEVHCNTDIKLLDMPVKTKLQAGVKPFHAIQVRHLTKTIKSDLHFPGLLILAERAQW